MSDFEVAMGAMSLGVYDSFGDSFSVKLSELVNKVEILKENWPSGSSSHRVLVVINRHTSARSQSLSLHICFIN
jgi:hypothetical protein